MDWLFNFPFTINLDTDVIDQAVRGFRNIFCFF